MSKEVYRLKNIRRDIQSWLSDEFLDAHYRIPCQVQFVVQHNGPEEIWTQEEYVYDFEMVGNATAKKPTIVKMSVEITPAVDAKKV